jgi:hypothetical protein
MYCHYQANQFLASFCNTRIQTLKQFGCVCFWICGFKAFDFMIIVGFVDILNPVFVNPNTCS